MFVGVGLTICNLIGLRGGLVFGVSDVGLGFERELVLETDETGGGAENEEERDSTDVLNEGSTHELSVLTTGQT